MTRIIKNPIFSWCVRCVFFGPLALWFCLFLWGWYTRYLDPGPKIEGRTLYEWGDMFTHGYWDEDYTLAAKSLSLHLDEVVPTAIAWTHTRESLAREVFFATTIIPQGKGFTVFGEEAHGYRGMGANILGIVALSRSDAYRALEHMAYDPNLSDYERDIARGHLGLQRAIDGWSSSTIKSNSTTK
jgi:hypothetical protein